MNAALAEVESWMRQVVVGLGLCPFAAHPLQHGRVRLSLGAATDEAGLLALLADECRRLDATPATQLETTVIVVPELLHDFAAYNDFLDPAEALLREHGWEGTYQIASFHPHYRFAGTVPDDPGNLTNRAPYPLLHLLREASVAAALDDGADSDAISARNIRRLTALTSTQRHQLFGARVGTDGTA